MVFQEATSPDVSASEASKPPGVEQPPLPAEQQPADSSMNTGKTAIVIKRKRNTQDYSRSSPDAPPCKVTTTQKGIEEQQGGK